jgi:hypothetical protein
MDCFSTTSSKMGHLLHALRSPTRSYVLERLLPDLRPNHSILSVLVLKFGLLVHDVAITSRIPSVRGGRFVFDLDYTVLLHWSRVVHKVRIPFPIQTARHTWLVSPKCIQPLITIVATHHQGIGRLWHG